MNLADWIGSLGVFLILLAYVLNLKGRLRAKALFFILLNLIGAGLACLASVLIEYWPFAILEGCWAIISLWALFSRLRTNG